MSNTTKIVYWVSTVWLLLGMLSSVVVQLIGVEDAVRGVTHLGYPAYLLTILGIWKILGVVTVLAPGLPVLKEWAYAGFFFAMSGAFISHLVMRDPAGEVFPSLLTLVLTIVSWYFRPSNRRVAETATQTV